MAQFAPQYRLMDIIDGIKSMGNWIFWLIFSLSITPLVAKKLNYDVHADDLINVANIMLLILFFILEVVVDYWLYPQAESRRRDDFLDNSFGSTFSAFPSINYFDTDEVQQGTYKAACNLFENCFFTYSLVKATLVKKTVVPILVLICVAVTAYYGFRQVPFALTLLQTLFSTTLLGEVIRQLILLMKLEEIYDAWVSLFQHGDLKINTSKYELQIFRYWHRYEALHNRMPAGISKKNFTKLNPSLTSDWINIKTRYNIH